jgi:hypothetical protein
MTNKKNGRILSSHFNEEVIEQHKQQLKYTDIFLL